MTDADARAGTLTLSDTELDTLLTEIRVRYGHDFSTYSRASLRRRILYFLKREGTTAAALTAQVCVDHGRFEALLKDILIATTEMFRDPDFYRTLRKDVVPWLRTFPTPAIWSAGCATGEEVWSLAILLHEEGILHRCRIYATDLMPAYIKAARAGVFRAEQMQGYSSAYLKAGGAGSLADYYETAYGRAVMRPSLCEGVVWARHSLVTDGSFCEAQLILCRNVMIYFQSSLRARAVGVFADSLCRDGYLALGQAESLRFTEGSDRFSTDRQHRYFYRRV